VESLLIDKLQFERKNVYTYRDFDLRSFEKLLQQLELNEIRTFKPYDDHKFVFLYFYFCAHWEVPGGNFILNMQTREKINVQERLLDLAENDRAIVLAHRDSELRFKLTKEAEFTDDPFIMATYQDGFKRFIKFHAPFDKLNAHISDKLDSLQSRLLLFPTDFESTSFIKI
jgi:hypothetical protein